MNENEINMFQNYGDQVRKIVPFSDEELLRFKGVFTIKDIKKNHFILKEGQPCRNMGFVHQGLLREYYLKDGKEINTQFFSKNQYAVSYVSFLKDAPSKYYIQALEDSTIISFGKDHLSKVYQSSHIWEQFGRKIAEKIYLEAMERAESFLFVTAEERYLNLLSEKPEIFQNVPLYHIASFLGIERESLSRLRKNLLNNSRL